MSPVSDIQYAGFCSLPYICLTLCQYEKYTTNAPCVGGMFSNDLIPFTKSFCRASLTCFASIVFEYSKTTCCSIFSSISSVNTHSPLENIEKLDVISGNALQISHADFSPYQQMMM